MRIGILTFHKVINYGAFLQAFSLSQKLQKQFPNDTVEIVDYIVPKERINKAYRILWNIKHHGLRGGVAELKKMQVFRGAQKNLPLSPRFFCTGDLQKICAYIDQRYDLLVIGSDAVFNWNQTDFPTAFIPDYPFTIPVCTYAASVHGLRFYDATAEQKQLCGNVFGSMAHVGVRDACSERFVQWCNPEANVMHCCDPTVFIDTDEIYRRGRSVETKLQKEYGFSLKSKYIVVMAQDSAMIEAVARRYGKDYKIVSVFLKSAYADLYLSDLDPFEWTAVLRHAGAVITSYFHGALLSLVQGTPVIVLDYSGYCDEQYEGKLRDLMVTRLSMPELYFDKQEAIAFDNNPAFYEKLDALLAGEYRATIDNAMAKERETAKLFMAAAERCLHG